jgi:hypothetical protein
MDENMRSLIEVTKLTSEATEASKARHRDEMEKIKKRQLGVPEQDTKDTVCMRD